MINEKGAPRPVAARPGPTLETAEAEASALLHCPRCDATYSLTGAMTGNCPVCHADDPNSGGSPADGPDTVGN